MFYINIFMFITIVHNMAVCNLDSRMFDNNAILAVM